MRTSMCTWQSFSSTIHTPVTLHAPYNLNSALYGRLCVYNNMLMAILCIYNHTAGKTNISQVSTTQKETLGDRDSILWIYETSEELWEVRISSRKYFACEGMVLGKISPCFLWIEEISAFQEVDLWTFEDKRCHIDAWFGLLWW